MLHYSLGGVRLFVPKLPQNRIRSVIVDSPPSISILIDITSVGTSFSLARDVESHADKHYVRSSIECDLASIRTTYTNRSIFIFLQLNSRGWPGFSTGRKGFRQMKAQIQRQRRPSDLCGHAGILPHWCDTSAS